MNGEHYSSLKEYREKQKLAEKKTLSLKNDNADLVQGVPLEPDPLQGKTVSLGPDGVMWIHSGIDDPGKPLDKKSNDAPVNAKVSPSSPVDVAKDVVPDPTPDENAKKADMGRIAGIEPSVGEIVRDFKDKKPGSGAEPIKASSMDEIEQDLRQKLEAKGRPILFVSDKNKLKVMELQAQEQDLPASAIEGRAVSQDTSLEDAPSAP